MLDHGANTKMKVRFGIDGLGVINEIPLLAAKLTLYHEKTYFEATDTDGVDGLKGIIRLLKQEAAVHAVSWTWTTGIDRAKSTIRPLPAFKIRPGKPKVLLAAMDRYSKKQDGAFLGYGKDDQGATQVEI